MHITEKLQSLGCTLSLDIDVSVVLSSIWGKLGRWTCNRIRDSLANSLVTSSFHDQREDREEHVAESYVVRYNGNMQKYMRGPRGSSDRCGFCLVRCVWLGFDGKCDEDV